MPREVVAAKEGPAWPRWLVLGLLAAALVYLFLTIWDRDAVMRWISEARPLPFFVALAVLPALGAPLTPFFVLAGASFGVMVGLIGTGLALAVNFTLCYAIARSSLRPRFERLLRRFDRELPDLGQPGEKPLRFTVMLRLAPGVPGFVKNYALGIAGVPFPQYFVASMLVTGVFATLLIVLGESLLLHDVDRSVLAGALVVIAAGLGVWWWRARRRRRGREATAA